MYVAIKGKAYVTTDLMYIATHSENILKSVYNNFSQFSAWKLREMTHNEEPWKSTEQSQEINPQLIKDFFVKEYIE